MLVCPVCMKEYATSGDHQPRLLIGCGHTFCQKCLDEKQEEEGITCPQCNLITRDPHVPNITIMNYVAAVKVDLHPGSMARHPLPPPQKSLCQDCKKELASLICFQCLPAGFMFCASCSEKEHSRPFGPVKEHKPKRIDAVRFSTPVPMCKTHQDQPCLLFSSKLNEFACETCNRTGSCLEEDEYISIEEAVEQVRNDLPSLMQLVREKVETIVKTRATLDELLKKVDLEKTRAMDLVHSEFSALELALKKRLAEVTGRIEEEAQFQRKSLIEQQERLELAQGNADTAIVRGNWLLQMADYTHLQQAESILSRIRSQLADEDLPLYQTAITTGEIPVYLPPNLLQTIEGLGCVGGGKVPGGLSTEISCGLLLLKWEHGESEATEYEIRYEPVEEKDTDPISLVTGDYSKYKHNFPRSISSIPSSATQKLISGIMPQKKYCFRIRALNIAGWGIWSRPMVGAMPGFPLTIEYTGEIVEIEVPFDGLFTIIARGAKAADGDMRKGGRGAIIEATFHLERYERLIILCGGMSKKVFSSTGGGGGTFVALNKRNQCLIAAGGGGGTRGHDAEDHDGRDGNTDESGLDGVGEQWAEGGAGGGAGKDATFSGPCWGYGGAGFYTTSTKSKSFLNGGEPGEGGGFGGGGAVGLYGGGGGGGYSGGGGGRGGGGGGSYVKEDGIDAKRSAGNMGNGSVTIIHADADIED